VTYQAVPDSFFTLPTRGQKDTFSTPLSKKSVHFLVEHPVAFCVFQIMPENLHNSIVQDLYPLIESEIPWKN
jgi:hypothetical protein